MKILLLITLFVASLWAGTYEQGLQAAENGDYKTAYKYLKPLAIQGDPRAQYKIGELHTFYAFKDPEKARKWYTLSAKQGYYKAQTELGLLYRWGYYSIKVNPKKALKWFKLAAMQGDSAAQYSLGAMYLYGEGTHKDYKEAIKWYTMAAKQGHMNAQSTLGHMYEKGQGTPQNKVKAYQWLSKAAKQSKSYKEELDTFCEENPKVCKQ